MTSSWTEERTEFARKLWIDGLSARQIAGQLGGVTRNAVIGKMLRLGLLGRANRRKPSNYDSPQRQRARQRRVNQKIKRLPSRPQAVVDAAARAEYERIRALPDLDIPVAERKTIATLENRDCRWPYNDPKEADFYFCGRRKVSGLPYCEFHARRAFQPVQPRRIAQAEITTPVGVPSTEPVKETA